MLDWPKSFAVWQNVLQIDFLLIKKVENIVGNGEKLTSIFFKLFFSLAWNSIIWITLTLSQMTNCTLFQTEKFCRWQFWIWWKWQEVLWTVTKHCGKRRNCLLRAISLFLTVFSKDLYCSHVKTRKGLIKRVENIVGKREKLASIFWNSFFSLGWNYIIWFIFNPFPNDKL